MSSYNDSLNTKHFVTRQALDEFVYWYQHYQYNNQRGNSTQYFNT